MNKAKQELTEYLLSEEYIVLLERALYSRLSTSTNHKNKHIHAINLLELYKLNQEE